MTLYNYATRFWSSKQTDKKTRERKTEKMATTTTTNAAIKHTIPTIKQNLCVCVGVCMCVSGFVTEGSYEHEWGTAMMPN